MTPEEKKKSVKSTKKAKAHKANPPKTKTVKNKKTGKTQEIGLFIRVPVGWERVEPTRAKVRKKKKLAKKAKKVSRKGVDNSNPKETGAIGGKISGGHNAHNITVHTLKIAEKLASKGATIRQIAEALGMGEATLRRHCKKNPNLTNSIRVGKAKADEKVLSTLYSFATDGQHPNMTQYYSNSRMGWKETNTLELIGGDKPIKTQQTTVMDLSKLSTEELKRMRELKEEAQKLGAKAEVIVETQVEVDPDEDDDHGGLEI